jgi:hypothetical protein
MLQAGPVHYNTVEVSKKFEGMLVEMLAAHEK